MLLQLRLQGAQLTVPFQQCLGQRCDPAAPEGRIERVGVVTP